MPGDGATLCAFAHTPVYPFFTKAFRRAGAEAAART
jgi:hypothetical protein